MNKKLLKFLILSALTVSVLFITAFGANAAIAGDVTDTDKKVTAADARLILRVSVNLDSLSEELLGVADVNEDSKITAADAREVLRMSVGLEEVRHYYTKEMIKAPTCTETGMFLRTCTECDDSYEQVIDALGHNYPNPEILIQVTCETDGLVKYTCKTCGESKEEVVAAGHIWDPEEATCTEAQYCIRGKHIGEPALGHTTGWGTCTRCNVFITDKYAHPAKVIKEEIPVAAEKATEAYNVLQKSSTGAVGWLKDYAAEAKPLYEASRASYQAAADACADGPELAELKAEILKAIGNTDKILTQIDVITSTETITDQNFITLISAIDTPQWANDEIAKTIAEKIIW